MPKRAKKPQPVLAPPESVAPPVEEAPSLPQEESQPESTTPSLPVVYDRLKAVEYSIDNPEIGPLGPDDIVLLMDWQTEKEYQEEMVQKHPESSPAHWLFGEVYHCLDDDGNKVRCWANANNRPFDMEWCEALIDTLLKGQWAGPLMMPGETINGETIRISRYGRVLSGQHQMTACKIADQRLQKSRKLKSNAADPKYPAWNGRDQVVLETLVVTGLSEDERVLRSIDYVKPRTVADMLYTMEVFRSNTPMERREMTRMLSGAIDMLWTRTDTKGYKTHPEVVGFLERHKRLLKCVEHLFVLNKGGAADGRKISKLRLNAGQCAALCYIMGSSGPKTNGDEYRNEFPPSEKNLDWEPWQKAKDFWANLSNVPSAPMGLAFKPVRVALGRLMESTTDPDDGNIGLGGRLQEKLAILAHAWERWKDHPETEGAPDPFDEDEDLAEGGLLCLSYNNLDDEGNELPDGQIKLIDDDDFYGIDCPGMLGKKGVDKKGEPMPPPMTREEVLRATEEARARRGLRS